MSSIEFRSPPPTLPNRYDDTRHLFIAQAGRTLHLLDVANLAGTSRPTIADLQQARAAYEEVMPVARGDLVVAGCDRGGVFDTADVWPHARVVFGRGSNGADHALLSAASERVAQRFSTVVIGSGDGIFADTAARLRSEGVTVAVVSVAGSLAYRLALAAEAVRLIGDAR